MVRWQEVWRVAQVPLAKNGSSITALFHQLSQSDFLITDAYLRARTQGPVNPDAIGVATRQQTGPRRRANRLRHVEVTEDASLRRQPVQVGRFETSGPKHTDIRIALVIGENNDNVRRCRFARVCHLNRA